METIKLTFTGDPANTGEKRDELIIGDLTFPLGKEVEVPDTAAFRKLAHNSHFNSGAAPKSVAEKPKSVAELKEALTALGVEIPEGALKADLQALLDETTK